MMKKIILFVTFLFLFTFNSFALEIKPFGIELGKKLEVELLEPWEPGYNLIDPPIKNSNFDEYSVVITPKSQIVFQLIARRSLSLPCEDLFRNISEILIEKYNLENYYENLDYGFERRLKKDDFEIIIKCTSNIVLSEEIRQSYLFYIFKSPEMLSIAKKEYEEYLEENKKERLNTIDQKGL